MHTSYPITQNDNHDEVEPNKIQHQYNENILKTKTILELSKKGYNIGKITIFILAIGVLLLGKALGVPKDDYKLIHDPVMYNWLGDMNEKVNTDETAAKALQISSSILMDLSFFVMFGYWVYKINTGRVIYSVVVFYVTRSIMQQFVIFPFPEGFFWEDPGFPSLTVPYGRSSDFFWSGHCGFLMVLACEWFVQKKYYMFIIQCLVDIYMATVMIGFRIHYTVDVIIGVAIAHYIFMLFIKASPYLDEWIKRLINFVLNLIRSRYNNKNITPVNQQSQQSQQKQQQQQQQLSQIQIQPTPFIVNQQTNNLINQQENNV